MYLPKDVWYDWYTQDLVSNGTAPRLMSSVQTPLDYVPVCTDLLNELMV